MPFQIFRRLILCMLAFASHASVAFADPPKQVDEVIGSPPSAILKRSTKPAAGSLTPFPAEIAAAPQSIELTPTAGEVRWKANIDFSEGQIFNPKTGKFDKVRLRTYQGPGTDPKVPFVAPTVSLSPGDTFRITLHNNLPADDPSCRGGQDPNVPHCFNSTNLHTHGLWVSPVGNSDNVLIRIMPGVSFTYEYNIPADHPAGTFWYHPHLHGSTALQVSSGMAGALIIRGQRLPSSDKTGDVDTLLRNQDGSPFPETTLLFQQIQYACRDEAGRIKTDDAGVWICESGDVGAIEGYFAPTGPSGPDGPDQFGPGTWPRSGRYTSINGHVVPTFESRSGQIERWRLIHAGVRDTIKPSIKKLSAPTVAVASAAAYTAVTADAQAAFVESNCNGATVPQLSLATDGLTRVRLVQQTDGVLQPGYREDVLVVFPEPGIYCVVDGEAEDNETVTQLSKSRKLLGYVRVAKGAGTGRLEAVDFIKRQLIEAAQLFMPDAVKAGIISDLDQNFGLAAFQPHESLMTSIPDGRQTLGFVIRGGPVFQIGELDDQGKLKNPQSYAPDRVDRNLRLGAIEDWDLRSFLGGHPFHIHVNPFQIVEVLDADGNDVSGYEPGNASPYAKLKGVWKDTIFVTQQRVGNAAVPYRIRVRTEYRRYIGDFVLHCHILDHEDQGMMQNVRISLPDGKGGIAPGHH